MTSSTRDGFDSFRGKFEEAAPDAPKAPPNPDEAGHQIVHSALRVLGKVLDVMVASWEDYPRPTPEKAYDSQRRLRAEARYILKRWQGCQECPLSSPCRVDDCRELDRLEAVRASIKALCWHSPSRDLS